MPDIAVTDGYGMLYEDWGSAYRITRTPGTMSPYQAERRDDPAAVLLAATPGALREMIRADYFARPPEDRTVNNPDQPAKEPAPRRERDQHVRCQRGTATMPTTAPSLRPHPPDSRQK